MPMSFEEAVKIVEAVQTPGGLRELIDTNQIVSPSQVSIANSIVAAEYIRVKDRIAPA